MKRNIMTIFVLVLCMGLFSATAFATEIQNPENLTVNAAWIDGDLMRLDVTDKATGERSSMAVRLGDYINENANDEFITIQTVDSGGVNTGEIRLKNPYYKAPVAAESESVPTENESQEAIIESLPPIPTAEILEPPANILKPLAEIENVDIPFTPNGTGTVIDNATDKDGNEFFTVTTEDKSVFYLVIDRQRNSDNVYLLDAVTEEALLALANKSGKKGGIGTLTTPLTESEAITSPKPSEAPEQPKSKGRTNSTLIFIVIAALAVGGAGYYFKFVKGKNGNDYLTESEDEFGYADESDECETGEPEFEPDKEEGQ